MAKLCYFYGLKPHEVLELDALTQADLWLAITQIEAQDFLIKAKIALLPQMKPADRTKIMREMHKEAHPRGFDKKIATLTAKDLASKMALRAKYG